MEFGLSSDLKLKEERERGNGTILLFSLGTLLFALLVQILHKGELTIRPRLAFNSFGKENPDSRRQIEDGPAAGPQFFSAFFVPGNVKEIEFKEPIDFRNESFRSSIELTDSCQVDPQLISEFKVVFLGKDVIGGVHGQSKRAGDLPVAAIPKE